ncbi:MAG TPA: MBL fold metallo-hydrolase [Thermoanaerobaculia bacterium]|nr:MBL fold metallo-hydrolase [Thermoanaerobaculia bacterium]
MAMTHEIGIDLARVWTTPKPSREDKPLRYLAFGDEVEVEDDTSKAHVRIRTAIPETRPDGSVRVRMGSRFIVPKKGLKPKDVLKPLGHCKVMRVEFVDVQQGDGALLVTPSKKVMLVDGGDNQLFARYLAGRFRRTSLEKPKDIDCILVTHGDADHFAGLREIHDSESHETSWKQLYIRPHRVYHNGLVKRPSKENKKDVPDVRLLGPTEKLDGRDVIVGLESDLLAVPDSEMNLPFRRWKEALATYRQRYGPIEFRRLQKGDDAAFDFLGDGLKVEVLGPIPVTLPDGQTGIPFLGKPRGGPHLGNLKFEGVSASHTINGHSVVLRITYGNVRYLFAADLNQESEMELLRHDADRLEAEVLKTPHHGSADFSTPFIKAVRPVVSVVSSGDESEQKEHIHPRATLVGALGRHSRVDEPIVLITELAAFFEVRGYVGTKWHAMAAGLKKKDFEGAVDLTTKKNERFFAFSRSAFGIVRTRTDGKRLVVYTDSGDVAMKEAYAFDVEPGGIVKHSPVRMA